MTHALKVWKQYYPDVESGQKPFELRRFDRDYKVGDKLLLQEWDNEQSKYTGQECEKIIIYVLSDCPHFGLIEGFCILGIKEKGY